MPLVHEAKSQSKSQTQDCISSKVTILEGFSSDANAILCDLHCKVESISHKEVFQQSGVKNSLGELDLITLLLKIQHEFISISFDSIRQGLWENTEKTSDEYIQCFR